TIGSFGPTGRRSVPKYLPRIAFDGLFTERSSASPSSRRFRFRCWQDDRIHREECDSTASCVVETDRPHRRAAERTIRSSSTDGILERKKPMSTTTEFSV